MENKTIITITDHNEGVAPFHVKVNEGSTYEYKTVESLFEHLAQALVGKNLKDALKDK